MKTWLIADSGGTSTSWAYGNDKLLGRFQTSSLHPRNLKHFPDSEKQQLVKLNKEFQFDEVLFYGAGMGTNENRQLLRDYLKEIQFGHLEIGTDALAAGLACCGMNPGFVAILGTGSILLEMNRGEVINRIGGLGPEKGDEGSGFYFGKLVRDYLIKSDEWKTEWTELFGSRELFMERYPSTTNPSDLAALAKKLTNKDFLDIHTQNIDLFIETHLKFIQTDLKVLNVVGSYGFHQNELIRERLKHTGWGLNKCLIDPMDGILAFYFEKNQLKKIW